MIYVYNNFKEEDYKLRLNELNRDYTYILNNMNPNTAFLNFLDFNDIKYLNCNKLYEGISGINQGTTCLDAENYKKDLVYTKFLAKAVKEKTNCEVLLPEDLGGDKYKDYNSFILNLNLKIIIMERTYNVWKPWEILMFWKRNEYLRTNGIKTVIGIWPDTLPKFLQWIQYMSAKLISGNNIMYYSEEKNLPQW